MPALNTKSTKSTLKGFFGSLTTLAYGAKIFLTGMPISSSAQHARMGDLSWYVAYSLNYSDPGR
jgi:hypothetical protein